MENSNEMPSDAYTYPCDIPAASAPVHSADQSYPCDEENSRKPGKGRRGGNAAGSVVVHSGKFRPEKEFREGWNRSEDGARPFSGRGSGNRRFEDRPHDGKAYEGKRYEGRRYEGKRSDGSGKQLLAEVCSGPLDLSVTETTDIGAFVEPIPGQRVLLPFAEQIGRPVKGQAVRVWFYEDKGGRITATMRTPILNEGETGVLKVAAVTRIGAFLDNGIPKQVLLPFKEQIQSPKEGDQILVHLYRDKSGRQAATMRVYNFLKKKPPYAEGDRVTGFVYEINPRLGIFVAVDNQYYGMIPASESFKNYSYGDVIEARVARVREDGKMDLLDRDPLYMSTDQDAEAILYELRRKGGRLPYADKADAAFIEETYAMSKNQFKRALGQLYRQHQIEIDREEDSIRYIGP